MHNSTGLGIVLLAGALFSPLTNAALVDWQNSVINSDLAASVTYFDPVTGFAPVIVDVGPLSGDRTFEFIVNAGFGGVSSALMGAQNGNGNQGLKFEQWSDQLVMGLTVFGSVDYSSTVSPPTFTDTHIAFVSDGFTGTDIYVNGSYAYTFFGVPLTGFGQQGLGGIYRPLDGSFFDVLDGTILGYASYDGALTPDQVAAHATAFTVPEPGSAGLALAGSVALIVQRRGKLSLLGHR